MKTPLLTVAASAVLSTAIFLKAAEPEGKLGMKAPPLAISAWHKGKPVPADIANAKNVTVVEFWATWCGPCKESIPHLTELQKKYAGKGVTIIGITDESADEVKPFLKKMGSKMDYTVASDNATDTWNAYMKAFDQEAIPYAFIVDRAGKIAWHGSPLEDFSTPLEQIANGTYDLAYAIFKKSYLGKIHDYLHRASDGDSPLARAEGRNLLDEGANYPNLLNDLAWEILTHDDDIKFRDKALAVEAARAANKATGGKDASILDTLALALFETGQTVEAVKTQEAAIKYCDDKELKASLKDRLEKYKKAAK